jgi:hypothetical protein
MKKFVNMFLCGVVGSIGYLTGVKVFDTLNDPVKRAEIKRKFNNVKNAFKN